ncbi:MAG: valine--tRNA ligase, partial [Burkholderiales bacterium]|nr:valine--tRNA ligase [Burkholderiales bacterium]
DSEEEDGTIWEIRYPFADAAGAIVVATTRPETMLGDTAVAVSPNDERYLGVPGRRVSLPLTDRDIPVIADNFVDPAFGTGCVKITPAHDFNDFAIAQRHGLDTITIMSLDGSISHAAPPAYRGLDRFEARRRIVSDLRAQGLLVSEKAYRLRVPRSGRTGVIVEPMLTDQWFVSTGKMAQAALRAVETGAVRFFPDHWSATYNHWLDNIQDWCISRQLWWGHQIPCWYDQAGNAYVARTEEQAVAQAAARGSGGPLRRDEDVLDTWFSSALVPFSSLGWPEATPDLDRYLPSSVLVTGFDIIFFWVARMIMMTLHFTGKVPFGHVYINALVRDADGQKMSKSKGNTLDPIDLIDGISLDALLEKSTVGLLRAEHKTRIEEYIRRHFSQGIPSFGADALRVTFASLATFARTLNFDLSRCEGYRNFCNKLWNAARFVLLNAEGRDCGLDESLPLEPSSAELWITSALQRTELEVERGFADYRFDNAAAAIYRFVWDEYCDWYLEIAKVRLNSGTDAQQRSTRRTLVRVLETVLRLAHPIMPFITEELWQSVAGLAGRSGASIMMAPYPRAETSKIDEPAEAWAARLKELVLALRNLRGEMSVPPSERIALDIVCERTEIETYAPVMAFLARLSEVRTVPELPASDAPVAVVGPWRLMLHVDVDPRIERDRLARDVARVEMEISRARTKLSNKNFVDRAPASVVALERDRLAGFEDTLSKLLPRLESLRSR